MDTTYTARTNKQVKCSAFCFVFFCLLNMSFEYKHFAVVVLATILHITLGRRSGVQVVWRHCVCISLRLLPFFFIIIYVAHRKWTTTNNQMNDDKKEYDCIAMVDVPKCQLSWLPYFVLFGVIAAVACVVCNFFCYRLLLSLSSSSSTDYPQSGYIPTFYALANISAI